MGSGVMWEKEEDEALSQAWVSEISSKSQRRVLSYLGCIPWGQKQRRTASYSQMFSLSLSKNMCRCWKERWRCNVMNFCRRFSRLIVIQRKPQGSLLWRLKQLWRRWRIVQNHHAKKQDKVFGVRQFSWNWYFNFLFTIYWWCFDSRDWTTRVLNSLILETLHYTIHFISANLELVFCTSKC